MEYGRRVSTDGRYEVVSINLRDRRYEFYVTGSGAFPWDMLRYDEAWPVTSVDAALLSEKGFRSIRLSSNRKPTIDRWQSFVWSVGLEKL